MADNANTNVETNATQETSTQSTPEITKSITVEQIDEIVSKRLDGVLKSVVKSQTSSDDEAQKFFEDYKKYKETQSKKNETNIADITSQLEKANAKVKELELNNAVIMAAQSSGLDNKTIGLFMKSFDTATIYDEKGNVDVAKIKDGITQFLEDFPGLKPTKSENKPHIKVGAQAQEDQNVETIQDKINKAMGIKTKK